MSRLRKSLRLSVQTLEARETPAAGQLDTTFGPGGAAVTSVRGSDTAPALVIDPAGRLVIAGTSDGSGAFQNMSVVRYNPDGTLDRTFGTFGKVTVDFGSTSDDSATSLALAPDGKIVLGGYANSDFA